MVNPYLERVERITALKGYSYQIWEYQASLSELVIRARHHSKPKYNIHIVFQGVAYLQMPIYWEGGDFRLGSEDERAQMAKQMGQDDLVPDRFFVAQTPKGPAYVVGSVAAILENVEPVY
jgi:hypothetical protein